MTSVRHDVLNRRRRVHAGPLLSVFVFVSILVGHVSVGAAGGSAPSTSPTAASDASEEEEPGAEPTKTRWYGGKLLLFDAAAGTLFVLAETLDDGAGDESDTDTSDFFFALTALTYLAGPPVVHLFEGRTNRSGLSLGMRVGLPLTGFYLGLASADCGSSEDDLCGLRESVGGLVVGMVTASALDAFFARSDVPVGSARPGRPSLALTPCAGSSRLAERDCKSGAFTLTLGGLF